MPSSTAHADADLLVLGAGPAGAGAAWRAARAGHRVVVLERAGQPGGAAGSFEVDGVRVDHGSHRLHPSTDPAILADLRELLGDELQRRPRNGRVWLAGRWLRFPLRPGDLARHLPPGFAAAVLRDTLTRPSRRPRAPTFAEALRTGLGPTISERFYFPYARKIWGLEPDQIDAEQARRRVGAGSTGKLAHRVLTAPAARVARSVLPGAPRPAGGAFFWYPRRGFGAITEALATAATAAGAEVRYDAGAAHLALRPDGVRVTLVGGESLTARRVWSTIPLPALARIADPSAPAAVLGAAGQLRFRAMLLVYLSLETDRYTPYDAHYLPDGDTPVTRVSEPVNYRDGAGVDPAGRTVLCAEIPCDRGGELWRACDETLASLVERTLRDRGLPVARRRLVTVKRLAHAYPVYRVGFDRAFAALDDWAASQHALLTFGRQGLFAHDNTHHALAMAYAAAGALGPDGTFDDAAWSAARARFATHVVED